MHVSGLSGTGKTALVHEVFRRKSSLKRTRQQQDGTVIQTHQGLYVYGKYEQQYHTNGNSKGDVTSTSTLKPYSGLIMACNEICGSLLNEATKRQQQLLQQESNQDHGSGHDLLMQVRESIVSEFGVGTATDELSILLEMIPALSEIITLEDDRIPGTNDDEKDVNNSPQDAESEIESDGDSNNNEINSLASGESLKFRFQYALQRFLRLIGRFFQPLVMVIDDLQWADTSTFEMLLQAVIKDNDNPNIFFIGISRTSDDDDAIAAQNQIGNNSVMFGTSMKNADETTTGPSTMDFPAFLAEMRKISSDGTRTDVSRRNRKKYKLELTEIKLGNLDLPAVEDILRELLSLEDEDTATDGCESSFSATDHRSEAPSGRGSMGNPNPNLSMSDHRSDSASRSYSGSGSTGDLGSNFGTIKLQSFAQLCMGKTHGNPFFLRRYLSSLAQRKLLRFNFGSMKWTCDENLIHQETMATENVVQLLNAEMKRLQPMRVFALQIMACLGMSFRFKMIKLLWEDLYATRQHQSVGDEDAATDSDDDENIEVMLGFFVAEGYIRAVGEYAGISGSLTSEKKQMRNIPKMAIAATICHIVGFMIRYKRQR